MTTFTAIDPNGKTHTRTSKTRTYTHTVVGLPSSTKATLAAMSPEMKAYHRSEFKFRMGFLDGTSKWLTKRDWESEEQYLERSQRDREKAAIELDGCETAQDYENMKIVQAHRRIREKMAAGYYDTYQNFGWCGRPDLAAKLKARMEGLGYLNVTILQITC